MKIKYTKNKNIDQSSFKLDDVPNGLYITDRDQIIAVQQSIGEKSLVQINYSEGPLALCYNDWRNVMVKVYTGTVTIVDS